MPRLVIVQRPTGRTILVQNLSLHRDATETAKGQGLKRCHQAYRRRVSASDSRQRPHAPRANSILMMFPRCLVE
jgi:hypothetical protein